MNMQTTTKTVQGQPDYETVTVSPQMAQEWLSKSKITGRLDKRLISAYAADMGAHKWKLNGEPIIFSDRGELLAGRHRLWASIVSKTEFPTLVVRGVPSSAFDTIDTLRRRTMGDVLTIRQLPAGRQLSAALNLIWRCYRGDLERERLRVPIQEALHLLNVYPELKQDSGPRSCIEVARSVTNVIPHGMGIGFHFLFSRVSREKADELYQQIVDASEGGDDDGPGGKLYVALNLMQEGGGRRDSQRMRAYIIKAWNALYNGTQLNQLKFASNEKFPSIAGLDVEAESAEVDSDTDDAHEIAPTQRELVVEYAEITPERAQALLANNPVNRKPAKAVVSRYARDMRAGNWKMNGQTIKVSEGGRLIDGQHRLKACVESGRSFPGLIVTNVNEEAFDTFDLGAKKGYHMVLSERGEHNTTVLAAALKWVWLHEKNRIGMRIDQPTPAELDEVLERHPAIRDSLAYVNKIRPLLAPGIGVSMHHLCALKSKPKADEFFDRLVDGQMLTEGNPVYALREKLFKERANSRRAVVSEQERIVWIIKAWNAWISGDRIKTISWRRKGPGAEVVPALKEAYDAEG